MSRETWLPLVIVSGLGMAIGGGWFWWNAHRDAEAEAAREARIAADLARESNAMQTESARLLTDVLPGVRLGTDLATVRRGRPTDALVPSRSRTDPGFDLFEEQLSNGAQVMYAFSTRTDLLERVQMLSTLPEVSDIATHLASMHDRYGAPTGIWDCTDGGEISTRRFTWRGVDVALADIVLLYGGHVSLTLYVTTNAQMASSLQRAGCRPTPPGEIDQFPTSAPEDIVRAQQEEERATP